MTILGQILMWGGIIGGAIFGIQILIMAFKTSIGWGLACLLLGIPTLIFVAKNWATCKTPFLRMVACYVVMGVGMALTGYAMASSGMAQ
ncbi:MAG: hypothetical protein ABIV06_00295 [Thermoanaerobaculia bacterium]